MLRFEQLPEVSDRTRQAVQDYTALNTIITAIEQVRSAEDDSLALAIVETFVGKEYEPENVRLRFNCPLGRRAAALGMLRSGKSTVAGVMRIVR